MSIFLKTVLDRSNETVACETALFEVYAWESRDLTITREGFKQKVKETGKKVIDTLKRWFGKVKEFFKSVWAWITRHWNAFVDKFRGKKKVSNPKKMEEANSALISAHNCIVKVVGVNDEAAIKAAMAEAQDYFDIANEKIEEANNNPVEVDAKEAKDVVQTRIKYAKTGEEMIDLANKIESGNRQYVNQSIMKAIGNKLVSWGARIGKLNVGTVNAVVGTTGDPAVDDSKAAVTPAVA